MKQSHTLYAAAALAVVLAVLPAAPAVAQDERGWIVSLGAGAQLYPKYPGSEDLGLNPLPIVDLRREGAPLTFEAPDEGWGFGVLGSDRVFNFGPSIAFQGKRKEKDVGAAVGNVGFTVEAGAFAELFLGENFRLRAEGRRGLGGHEGWIGDLSADFVLRDRDTYVFSIGPRARISDDNYQDAYFSVTPAVAATTGLPAYDAGGGFHAVGAVAGLTYMLDPNWGLYGYAGYDRLIGDAADSPIVRNFGSRDQFSGGLGIFYSFAVGSLFGR
ncbi:MipA/OmpV family protein [Sphingosinicella sp. CPCC 101087]|uniref:MipA/OmpV family protein n=1 Tax=Sphingosinicella sp. CPCC 101087 TaxID=2497754 RepID=UPI00101DB0A4|nr:MipA/OmpV family protein [Sphingosinicella sp. CPCC 101087]